jgi:hypothetical protein
MSKNIKNQSKQRKQKWSFTKYFYLTLNLGVIGAYLLFIMWPVSNILTFIFIWLLIIPIFLISLSTMLLLTNKKVLSISGSRWHQLGFAILSIFLGIWIFLTTDSLSWMIGTIFLLDSIKRSYKFKYTK